MLDDDLREVVSVQQTRIQLLELFAQVLGEDVPDDNSRVRPDGAPPGQVWEGMQISSAFFQVGYRTAISYPLGFSINQDNRHCPGVHLLLRGEARHIPLQ